MTAAARETLDADMSEKEWQAKVVAKAKDEGWLVYHTYDSRRSYPGFPDLIIVRGPMLLALELKAEKGRRVTAQQQEWITALQKVKIVSADIARPHHWPDIERALTSRAR